ncbi:MAG: NAD(P)-dependent oxidoreductase [Flavobacteriales bacterium]|nr:NAD(P)-dependent oxidoreductase [Flavobacteriales bacterium]|tara:strand:+ start:8399 stop:9265 length:867 start_codon:yes stop_codon:yes gene_type:complete
MKVLITGGNGFLGKELRMQFQKNNYDVIATGLGKDRISYHNHIYLELDIQSPSKCLEVLQKHQPSIIINAAALTDVDRCQLNQSECLSINCDSLNNFIPYSIENRIHFIQISTDFVFNGKKGEYKENDFCDPVNYYGFSKLEAENKIIKSGVDYAIIRTSLLYNLTGNNFLTRFIKKIKENVELKIVDDQYRTPTYIFDLVSAILIIVKLKKNGIYHISSGESLSIFDIVCNFVKNMDSNTSLIKNISTKDLSQKAIRPINSSLLIDKAKKDFNFTPMNLNDVINRFL